jgi:hypothetical protein
VEAFTASSSGPYGDRRPVDDMLCPEDSEYEEGEEHHYDDDGAFGVGLPPLADDGHPDDEW